VGCRRVDDPAALVRVFVDRDGEPQLGAGPGRGAWLCRPPAALGCLDAAARRGALDRALRTPVTAPGLVALRAKLEGLNG
jgi:predicted RNA-binding protein YlxR (DUF448 family)